MLAYCREVSLSEKVGQQSDSKPGLNRDKVLHVCLWVQVLVQCHMIQLTVNSCCCCNYIVAPYRHEQEVHYFLLFVSRKYGIRSYDQRERERW